MLPIVASNGESETRGRNRRKAKVNIETSVPKGKKRKSLDVTSHLTNDTKVKNSISPKEIRYQHLEDTPITENYITNTTRVDETAVFPDMEKHLEASNFLEKIMSHVTMGARISHGSEGTLSSSDNSHRLKSGCKRDRLSNSKHVDLPIPLKRKKNQNRCINPQVYDDALDISEHRTNNKQDDLSNSSESSDTTNINNKAPEHKFKKKKIAVKQQDFDMLSPTVLHQAKQLMKDTQNKSDNFNASTKITKSCDPPETSESISSTGSILKMKPKRVLSKKVPRARGKNAFDSVMVPSNNNEPVAETDHKSGYISSGSVSSIPPAAVNGRHIFKQIPKHGMFDLTLENHVVEGTVQNMQPNVNDLSTSGQQSKDISAEMAVMKATAFPKIVGKINKKHLSHNFFHSVGNVEQNNSDVGMTTNNAQNTLAANTKESVDISDAELIRRKVLNKDKCESIRPQTLTFTGIRDHSHNSQSIEGRRRINEGDHNSSINKLVKRKFSADLIGTSEHNCPILPDCGRSTDSPGESLTVSRFRPKVTSSKIYLTKDGIAEQCPLTYAAGQLKIASNTMNVTHNERGIKQSGNPIAHQQKSTYDGINETNSVSSSDLTFEPDNVPHSTMVQSSSKKKHSPPVVHKMGSKASRSLLNSFLELPEVSGERGKKMSVGTENAGVRITSNGRECENELVIENERNCKGMKNSELQPNEHHSNSVEKEANFANMTSAPENLYANSISLNILKSHKLSADVNDVSKVFRHVSHKTKSMAKSSSMNSQKELVNADSKNNKKQQGNDKNVPGNSPENFTPQNMGFDTKCSVSLSCKENVSSHYTSKAHENSYGTSEVEQISPFETLAQKMCNSEGEEINCRKRERRAERRKSSSYSFVAVSCSKLSETGDLNSQKGSNLKSSSKVTGNSVENKPDYAAAPNCSEKHCSQKETPKQRGLASPSLSASYLKKTFLKENFSLNIKNNSEASIRESNKNSTISNVTNGKKLDYYLEEGLYRISQAENVRGSYADSQLHLTTAAAADDDAPGEKSVISREERELSFPLLAVSPVNTQSLKKNLSQCVENSSKIRSKESNKNSVISHISNAKIAHSVLSGLSNTSNDKRPFDYSKDSLHRSRQIDNGRQSNPDNQPQLIADNNGTEGERRGSVRQPVKDTILFPHRKKLDVKQTQAKPTARACFMIDGEHYHKPKLARPKPWINQRFYNHILPKFDKKYGLEGSIKYEDFVKNLCREVTACISNKKKLDTHVDKVQELLSKYLSINTYVEFLVFGQQYLPDEFVFKMCLTHEKRCKNK